MLCYKKIIVLVFLILSIFSAACSDEEDPVKLSVISTEGNFTGGFYKVDGGSTVAFTGESIDYNIYEYELEIDELDYLEVRACKNTEDQSIQIKIYRDDIKVKSCKIDPYEQIGNDYTMCLECDYELGEEETDDTTDTSE